MSDLRIGERVFVTEDPYYGEQGVVVGGGVEVPGEPEYYMVKIGLGPTSVEVNVPRQAITTVEERRRRLGGLR